MLGAGHGGADAAERLGQRRRASPSIVGEERVLVGLTYHSATLLGPGRVKHPGVGMTFMGELDGADTPRLEAAAAAFRTAGIE